MLIRDLSLPPGISYIDVLSELCVSINPERGEGHCPLLPGKRTGIDWHPAGTGARPRESGCPPLGLRSVTL